jgi:hypothetical protein
MYLYELEKLAYSNESLELKEDTIIYSDFSKNFVSRSTLVKSKLIEINSAILENDKVKFESLHSNYLKLIREEVTFNPKLISLALSLVDKVKFNSLDETQNLEEASIFSNEEGELDKEGELEVESELKPKSSKGRPSKKNITEN